MTRQGVFWMLGWLLVEWVSAKVGSIDTHCRSKINLMLACPGLALKSVNQVSKAAVAAGGGAMSQGGGGQVRWHN